MSSGCPVRARRKSRTSADLPAPNFLRAHPRVETPDAWRCEGIYRQSSSPAEEKRVPRQRFGRQRGRQPLRVACGPGHHAVPHVAVEEAVWPQCRLAGWRLCNIASPCAGRRQRALRDARCAGGERAEDTQRHAAGGGTQTMESGARPTPFIFGLAGSRDLPSARERFPFARKCTKESYQCTGLKPTSVQAPGKNAAWSSNRLSWRSRRQTSPQASPRSRRRFRTPCSLLVRSHYSV
jgi:hypothetical protein